MTGYFMGFCASMQVGTGSNTLLRSKPQKKRRRVALFATLVDHAMDRRDEEIVRLSLEAVCNVDDKRAWNRLCFDPMTFFVQNLQSACIILRDDGEAFDIRVGTDALLVVSRAGLRWIMQHAHTGIWSFDVLVEDIFRQMQGQRKGPSQTSCQFEKLCVVVEQTRIELAFRMI